LALGGWKTSSTADRYSHPTLHNDKIAQERSIPDYTLSSKQSQEQRKTGTDDSKAFLHNSCLPRAPIRSNTESSGKKNLDSIQKTALCVNNEGSHRTEHKLRKVIAHVDIHVHTFGIVYDLLSFFGNARVTTE